ncbi:MAG: cytochrome c biogenesis protein CcsA [Chloroflexi bacterium]|nr:cytochrome c biogenesis protein CcsA [Chloroflexota bacterium]
MLAEVGLASLAIAFALAVYAALASLLGACNQAEGAVLSGRNAALLTFPALLLSTGLLVIALLTEQYQISYVYEVTDPRTPALYRFTALWGSQRGSLLFWSLLMSAFTFAAIWLNWRGERRLMPYAVAAMMATLAFFLGLSLFVENPFERWWLLSDAPAGAQELSSALIPAGAVAPTESALRAGAQGLNPLLRHFGMIIHPPMLYLGFVGFTIPFAFALAALASGELSSGWIKATRRWSLIAWIFLSLGLILGGRWAYDVLGWGGYWGWDPVENAAFLPWLVGTAFIHSVMIQEKRGMLKLWNMLLVIASFSAVMFGTFATRSGVIESVHSFARSEVGFPMLAFWAAITLVALTALYWRWRRGELQDEHQFANLLSRESLFVLNNVVFIALFVAIFWGSFGLPITSELFFGKEVTIGAETFEFFVVPLFIAMYVLMGVAPLSAWGATSLARLGRALRLPLVLTGASVIALWASGTSLLAALLGYGVVLFAGYVALYEIYRGAGARRRSLNENWLRAGLALFRRNQRRYGGYIVHLGVTVIGIGVIGSSVFQTEVQHTVARGEMIAVQDYTLRYDDFIRARAVDGRMMNITPVTLFRNDAFITTLRPRIDDYAQMPMTIAGAHSTLENDFYVLLIGGDYERATFRIYINPLVNLVWWGGILLIIGTVIAVYPKALPAQQPRKPERVGQATPHPPTPSPTRREGEHCTAS